MYVDEFCSGEPLREMSFPTWSKPGSSCYHDAAMDGISVENQYCEANTGFFHENLYLTSTDCSTTWWDKWVHGSESGIKLSYSLTECLGGFKLKECVPGVCNSTSVYFVEEEKD